MSDNDPRRAQKSALLRFGQHNRIIRLLTGDRIHGIIGIIAGARMISNTSRAIVNFDLVFAPLRDQLEY